MFTGIFPVLLVILALTGKSGQKSPRDVKDSNFEFDFGSLKISGKTSETKSEDRLQLRKSLIKSTIKLPLGQRSIIKLLHEERMAHCGRLVLIEPDHENQIDCHSLEAFARNGSREKLTVDSDLLEKSAKFNRKSVLDLAIKLPLVDEVARCRAIFHPVKWNTTDSKLALMLKENGLGELRLGRSNENLGYYFEVSAHNLVCYGNVYFKFNRSDPFARDDSRPEIWDEIQHVARQARENGVLFSSKSTCKPRANSPLSLLGDLLSTIARLNFFINGEFPYFWLNHIIYVGSGGFKYENTIMQKAKSNSQHPQTYNTSINIKSESKFFPMLNFKLSRNFENLDRSINEIVNLSHIDLSSALSDSNWNPENLIEYVENLALEGLEFDTPNSDNSSESGEKMLYQNMRDFIINLYRELKDDPSIGAMFSLITDLIQSLASRQKHLGNRGNPPHTEL